MATFGQTTHNSKRFSGCKFQKNGTWYKTKTKHEYNVCERILTESMVIWTMAHDPGVPAKVRAGMGKWGLCADEFADNTLAPHWPPALYSADNYKYPGTSQAKNILYRFSQNVFLFANIKIEKSKNNKGLANTM